MRHRLAPVVDADSRVPALGDWPTVGISGQAMSGPFAGLPVVAVRMRPKSRQYVLYLPVDELRHSTGVLVAETDNVDVVAKVGGGLIDDVTRLMDVQWSTSSEAFERAIAWYRSRPTGV